VQLRSEDITWQEIDGELVILDTARSVYLTTNVAGATLTRLLTAERTPEELVAALATAFGVPAEPAEAATRAFVADLRAKGLLR